MRFILLRLLACTIAWLPSMAAGEDFSIEDFRHHVSISDPRLSPDRTRVAYVRTYATEALAYRYEIVVAATQGDARQVLTTPSQYAHHPRWVSNESLSFLAVADTGGHQVFVATLADTSVRQLTHHATALQGFAWSPDRSQLAFASRPASEPRAIKAFTVNSYTNTAPRPPQRLSILTIATDQTRVLPDARPIVDRWSAIHWHRDGRKLLFMENNLQHHDEYANHLVEYDVSQDKSRRLGSGAYPRYAPDGQQLLFLAREQQDYPVAPRKAFLLDPESGATQRVAPQLDRDVLGRFAANGSVLLNGPELHTQRLWLADGDGVEELDLADVEPVWPFHGSWVGDTLVFVGATDRQAQELYVRRAGTVERITAENAALSTRQRGRTQALEWQAPDGLTVTGLALLPSRYAPNSRYPLVVSPHGGPHTTTTRAGVAGNLINQTMASRGWIVLSPNYRGSTNLGRAFHMLRFRNPDYDREVIQDITSSIAALEEACNCVDHERVAILGTSYGGKVAAWATALHPELWRASVIGNANLDDVDSYVRSDRGPGVAARFGVTPWSREGAAVYRRASPVYAADHIRTPTLLLSTLRDPRVPVTSSFKFWKALEDGGAEVEFVAYDMTGHGPSDLANSMDYWQRAINWIDRHFLPDD